MNVSARSPATETITCPLCGASHFRVVLCGQDYMHGLPGEFQLARCAACGLLYQNPRPLPGDIVRYYPDGYGSYSSAVQGLRGRPGLAGVLVRRGLTRRARLLDRYVPGSGSRPRRLLDVGCASGLFLETMQAQSGWQVEGVELNVRAARAVTERLGVPVFAGPVEQACFPDASFDAITLWDVLEHLYDPVATLRRLRPMLRPGGAVFLRVPNAASYVARLCGRYWSGYDLPRHMTLFTPRTLSRALAAAGFSRLIRSYSSGSYLAALHSLRFALDDGRLPPARAAAIHRALLHPAFRMLAWGPFSIADRLAGGSNLEVLVGIL